MTKKRKRNRNRKNHTNQHNTRDKAIELKVENPDLTVREIGDYLGKSFSTIAAHLRSPEGQARLREIEEYAKNRLIEMRQRAIDDLEICLDAEKNPLLDLKIKFDAVKLILEPSFNALRGEIAPEEIEWESVITESGSIERTEKKIFRKAKDVTPGDEPAENDEPHEEGTDTDVQEEGE